MTACCSLKEASKKGAEQNTKESRKMVEGAKNFMQVPTELAEEVLAFLSAKYSTRTTPSRGEKPILWSVNSIGEISVKGLPNAEMTAARQYVRGVIDGISGVGFVNHDADEPEEEAEEV